MKLNYVIFIALLLITGCAATRPLADMAMGAGGGALAGNFSDGNPGIIAAGAAGGVLLSEGAFYFNGKQSQKAYVTGYEKGRSDAVKQQYWFFVRQQQSPPSAENVSLYPIPIPEQTVDGVILNPTTKFLRIEN